MRKYAAFALALGIAFSAVAQAPLAIYTDNLVNGFQDWSWSCNRNFANTDANMVHTGSYSVAVLFTNSFPPGTLTLFTFAPVRNNCPPSCRNRNNLSCSSKASRARPTS